MSYLIYLNLRSFTLNHFGGKKPKAGKSRKNERNFRIFGFPNRSWKIFVFQKAEILAENRSFPLGFRRLFRFRIEYRAIENWVV